MQFSLSDSQFTFSPLADLAEGQRWSTWSAVEKGAHGPLPRPDWVITDDAAIDTELGILKTGKEADVFLVERAVPASSPPPGSGSPELEASADGIAVTLAAKRYRAAEHRQFHRDAGYVEGRRTRRSRDMRAMAKGTTYGRSVAAGEWAQHEFAALSALWSAGVPVPYPVQIDGTEILMEFIGTDGQAAPRLAQTRPDARLLESFFAQIRDAMSVLARRGLAHGDLSPYNLLVDGERIVVIDLPQVIDIVANPNGTEFLARDCRNVCTWFTSRGYPVDPDDLLAELIASAY